MGDKINSELDCSFYFFRVVFSFRIVEIFYRTYMLYTHLLLFNFQRPFHRRFLRQPDYYSTSFFVCQGVFQKFFELFSIFFFKPLGLLTAMPAPQSLALERFDSISQRFLFVKGFLKVFFIFFAFVKSALKQLDFSSDSWQIALFDL